MKKVSQMDGQTDRQMDRWTDGRTDKSVLRAAWSQLEKIEQRLHSEDISFHPMITVA